MRAQVTSTTFDFYFGGSKKILDSEVLKATASRAVCSTEEEGVMERCDVAVVCNLSNFISECISYLNKTLHISAWDVIVINTSYVISFYPSILGSFAKVYNSTNISRILTDCIK